MGGSKKLKENEEEIDFNNPDSLKKVAADISKGKLKAVKGISDIPKKIIAFVTSNMKLVAIFAVYLVACGLYLNIKLIFKYDLCLYIIGFILSIIIFKLIKKIIFKFKNKKK